MLRKNRQREKKIEHWERNKRAYAYTTRERKKLLYYISSKFKNKIIYKIYVKNLKKFRSASDIYYNPDHSRRGRLTRNNSTAAQNVSIKRFTNESGRNKIYFIQFVTKNMNECMKILYKAMI